MYRILLLGVFALFILGSCSSPEAEKIPAVVTVADTVMGAAQPTDYRYEVFANVDSSGQQHGFGYDVYDGSKKLIHQTSIPGEPGTDGFVSEEEAAIIAQLVVEKLNTSGGFPTLSHEELVSKGITLKQ
jgi:glycogen debranching enzyme